MAVLLETTVGNLVIDLFVDARPKSALNFLKLCKTKYFNFCQIFKIESNYIAQTGDPTGTGRGGESIFATIYGDQARLYEAEQTPILKHRRRGLVSLVDCGDGMVGSQFFITLADNLDYLDGKHTIIGQVTEGDETLDALNAIICDDNNRPYKDVRVAHTIVLHDPFPDPPRLPVVRRSPSPTLELLTTDQISLIQEEENADDGKTEEEKALERQQSDMRSQAHILEMVGDLHHADEKPPDNVLFVCKLNPVTTDEDLAIIFARFGTIKCCEVIRDRRTGASLNYAFIEFEKPDACEAAFLKMDNVLIDDRRIHVDFSQSVAKNYQWKRQVGVDEPDTKRRRPMREESPPRSHSSRTRRPEKSGMH